MICALCSPMPVISSSRSHRGQQRGVGGAGRRLAVATGATVAARAGVGHRCQQLLDAAGEGGDLGGQGVDLVQQHPGQLAVVVVEAAVERGDELRALGLHLAARQVGEPARISFPGDQGLDHVAGRERVQRGGHRRDFDQRVLEQLFQPLPVAGPLPGQIHPQPGVVTQLPDRCRRHERRPQQPLLGQLGQPDSVEFVRFRPAWHVLHVAGVDQLHVEPGRLQQVVPDPPVVRRGLDGDLLDTRLDQLLGQLADRTGARGHVPHPAEPAACLAGEAHAHLARSLGHIDRRDPLDHQLVLGVGNLLSNRINRIPLPTRLRFQFACPPTVSTFQADRPGASVKGTEILTGVLEATMRDPNENWRVGHPADSLPVAAGG